MKTRINNKSFRNTKSPQSKKTRIQKKSRKQVKAQKQKKHSFYIVQCNNGLDTTILSRHLESLKLIPDSKAMNYVEKQYKILAAKNKLSKTQFCDSYDKHLLVKVPPGLVTAEVFFYHINNFMLDKPFYNYAKFLSNTINLDFSIIDKGILYSNIIKYNSRDNLNLNYFIEIFLLSNKKQFHFPENYILRPIYGFGGSGILYVHNPNDLKLAIKYYNTHKDIRNKLYSLEEITVSRIITDLLLFKGRKFHLRMYYIVAILEGEISFFLLDKGKILTARDTYNLNVPFSKGVHDTHFDSTDADYFFPNDLIVSNISSLKEKDSYRDDIFDTIFKRVIEIVKGISYMVLGFSNGKTNSLLFENQKNGYYIYGLDILVRDNLEPVLLECNTRVGFDCHRLEKKKELSEKIYGWINEIILEPLFKHPGKATSYARKHKTYIALH
jgi:hypothetical protein